MARQNTGSRERIGDKRRRPRLAAREKEPAPAKAKSAPSRSLAMKLAAEVDALKKKLSSTQAQIAELETRVGEDPLTGLLNRRGFMKALERTLHYARRYRASAALLFLDLDGFKQVNDRHGHAAGDWVLGRVGRLIAGGVRASDVAARVGGDEFTVILWNLSEAQAEAKARALEQMIETSAFERSGKRFEIGLSAGLTLLKAEDTAEAVLVRADAAMYARKRERKLSPSS